MSDFLVYIDTSVVTAGRLDELKVAATDLAEFVEATEPRIIAYSVFFTADGTLMTVLHIHPDSASLRFHLAVAGPRFLALADLLTLASIEIFGTPDDDILAALHQKARMLGGETVIVRELHAGFARFAPAEP